MPASWRNWIAFWILGTVNNFAYVVVAASAKSLACSFDQLSLLGAIAWSNVAVGVFVRVVNMAYMLHIPPKVRITGTAFVFVLGLIGVALSKYIGFWFAILSIVLQGGACSFGESVLLAHLKNYDVQCTNGWSSGTGMAGVGA